MIRWATGVVVMTALLLGLAPASAVAQTFEGVVTAKMQAPDSGRDPVEVQYLMRGGAFRMEVGLRGDTQGAGRSVIIVDPAAKTNYVLMPGRKMYMTMPITAPPGEHHNVE